MNKVAKDLGLALYIVFVLFMALIALGMSFISDGPVPLYVHITMFLLVVLVFMAPLLIWRRLHAGPVSSPLPARLRKHQDKIIVAFLIVWVAYSAISYFAGWDN